MQCSSATAILVCVFTSVRLTYASSWVVDDLGCLTPDEGSGDCIEQKYCDFVNGLIDKTQDSDKVKEILDDYGCGVDSFGDLKVCCPLHPYFPSVNNDKVDPNDHSKHRNIHLLPEKCGYVQAWGLYNGNVSNLSEFAWPALLKYKKNSDYLCGGSLISARYILTAAHCIRNDLYHVVLGEHDVTTSKDCTEEYKEGKYVNVCTRGAQFYDVSASDAIIHREYNSLTLANDIAIIRLSKSVDISSEVIEPICLPITPEEKHQLYKQYTVIGWGATDKGLASTVLLKKITQKIATPICQTRQKILTEHHICIQDSCVSDEGGLLMGYYDNLIELRTIQYGILSFRPADCGDKDVPGAYTDISAYVTWILDNIRP